MVFEILVKFSVYFFSSPRYRLPFLKTDPNKLFFVYLQRGDNLPKILVFTEDGYFLRAWNYTVDTPHGIFAASTLYEQSIWITDVGSGMYSNIYYIILLEIASLHMFLFVLFTIRVAESNCNFFNDS